MSTTTTLPEPRLVTKKRDLEHLLITKTNRLAQAGNNLTIIEAKVLEYCFANIFKKDNIYAHDVFEVDIDAMTTYFGLTRSNAYRELKQVFQSLASRRLKLEFGDTTIESAWLSAIHYNDTKGLLKLQLSPIVCQHVSFTMLQTESFTQYHLNDVAGLKHRFSIVLYNYLKSKSFKEENRIEIEIESLRGLFLLNENEFTLYGDLKRQLVKSMAEIEAKTKMKIVLYERKTGKRVTGLVFVVENENGFALQEGK